MEYFDFVFAPLEITEIIKLTAPFIAAPFIFLNFFVESQIHILKL